MSAPTGATGTWPLHQEQGTGQRSKAVTLTDAMTDEEIRRGTNHGRQDATEMWPDECLEAPALAMAIDAPSCSGSWPKSGSRWLSVGWSLYPGHRRKSPPRCWL